MLHPVFDLLGRVVARRPWTVILVWALVCGACYALAALGVGGDTVFDRLTTGVPAVPGSESARGGEILAQTRTSGPSLTLAVRGVDARTADLTGPMADLHADLAAVAGVDTVIDPFVLPDGPASEAAAPLIAADGEGFLVLVELEPGLAPEVQDAALAEVESLLRAAPEALSVGGAEVTGRVGGNSLILSEVRDQAAADLRRGEIIALPVALLVMVLVFGGFLAAAMPMVGALASIATGLGAVFGLSYLIDLDSSVLNVVTVLGLGLSIDYGLLIVSRYREELHRLVDSDGGAAVRRRRGDGAVEEALRATMRTAGRTVAYSALTVAISVAALAAFEPDILRAFGLAGASVVLIALTTALTLVPALLRLTRRALIRRGIIGRIPGARRLVERAGDATVSDGFFSRLASRVQRHPWLVLLGSSAALVLLAMPAADISLRNSTIELLPLDSDQRAYVEEIAQQYPGSTSAPVQVLAQATLEEADPWVRRISRLPGVAAVDPPVALDTYVFVGVRPDSTDPGGKAATDAVRAVRGAQAPFPVVVTGQAANQIDFVDALAERASWALGVVAVATLVLLFLMTGSVLVPIKALLTNALSLLATVGVLVWGFQDGHLEGLLGFRSTGGIETYVLALVVAFAFGLAMDYEVFLLSRIKEQYDAGRDNDAAVRLGLQQSGRIITSAAAIIIVVFVGFVFGELMVIKEVGFSLAVAVLIDATLVRLLLVPATMTLLGRANWWAPKALRRIHARVGLAH